SGVNVWCFQFFALRETQRHFCSVQTREHIVSKPGIVAKLKGEPDVMRQPRQEICQQRQVAFQIGRQLKQHRTELAWLLQWKEGSDEFRCHRIRLWRRLICLMVWCALTANLKPGGVSAIQPM